MPVTKSTACAERNSAVIDLVGQPTAWTVRRETVKLFLQSTHQRSKLGRSCVPAVQHEHRRTLARVEHVGGQRRLVKFQIL